MAPHEILAMLSAAGVSPTSLTADSRAVTPGDLFLAYPGHAGRVDGRGFIGDAIRRGASAVLWERADFVWNPQWKIANAGVADLKAQAGPLAGAVFGAPSEHLKMIGVTGTNGKTSVTQWLAQVLEACAMPCGAIGTLGNRFGACMEDAVNTTPDAVIVQRTLKRMRDAGAAACAMEVTSIALDQARVAGVAFDIAVFTNFTRDHLDYHGSMQAYEAAKTRLFTSAGLEHAVINIDDPMGVRLMAKIGGSVRRIAYCIAGESQAVAQVEDEGRLVASALRHVAAGCEFTLACDWGGARVAVPVWGAFNVANVLAVIAAALAAGAPFARVIEAVGWLKPVAGRMNVVAGTSISGGTSAAGGKGAPLVIIDYAHTPDALAQVLAALRPVARARGGRLAVVFGCGGDRDPGKRPLMGEIATRLADKVVLTSDNPRGEDPLRILDQIAAGVPAAQRDPDRARAISAAIVAAEVADVVLIAGKGHETTQEIGGRKLPFSDHVAASRGLHDRQMPAAETGP